MAAAGGPACCLPALLVPNRGGRTEEEESIIEDLEDAGNGGDRRPRCWDFPVALEDMNPEYIILANKHYLLDKKYVPKDLVKVPKDPEGRNQLGGRPRTES